MSLSTSSLVLHLGVEGVVAAKTDIASKCVHVRSIFFSVVLFVDASSVVIESLSLCECSVAEVALVMGVHRLVGVGGGGESVPFIMNLLAVPPVHISFPPI